MVVETCLLNQNQIIQFRQKIYDFYRKNKRNFSWRADIAPYRIVVSEIMLQQTQASRVVYKFDQWMSQFPDFQVLAKASVQEVLFHWQGLGYNRRGLALHDFAKRVVAEYAGVVPPDPGLLKTFRGIGPNTAGSICAFAFDKPVAFIETNIRTVFIHEFFKDEKNVDDKQLLPLIKTTIDEQNSREWYYALMDYGVYLKKELKISNKNSRHYVRQLKFIGSKRQVRGLVIKILTKIGQVSFDELYELVMMELPRNQHDLKIVLENLCKDGLVLLIDDIVKIGQ